MPSPPLSFHDAAPWCSSPTPHTSPHSVALQLLKERGVKPEEQQKAKGVSFADKLVTTEAAAPDPLSKLVRMRPPQRWPANYLDQTS